MRVCRKLPAPGVCRAYASRAVIALLVASLLLGSASPPALAADPPAGKAGNKAAPAAKAPAEKKSPAGKAKAADGEAVAPEHPFPGAKPAPALTGGSDWFNTAEPIDLKKLRGKFVVLDFWTFCCINCMHVLPVLKQLEHAYPNEVVVIGVHSAKFDGEQDSKNIVDAVQRYEIEHPVVNDAQHKIWDKYFVQSWPTLRVIDPEGNLVAGNSGEIEFAVLDQFFKEKLPYYREQGLLDTKPIKFELESAKAKPTPLRFPGKLLADAGSDRLFIADSNHNRIVVSKLDGTLIATIGSGAVGKKDGNFAAAEFDHPQGMALSGETLYVADTENHLLRKIDLAKQTVATIAGTGKQARGWPGIEALRDTPFAAKMPDRWVGKPSTTSINSPWSLWIHQKDLYIAMAGPHQIWKMPLDESEIGPYAGNSREDIVDGPLLPRRPYEEGYSSFAQPSGLASDGQVLYVADSEGSSIRAVPFDKTKQVRTVIGTANLPSARLFTFGDEDGPARTARLQHPLDVAFGDGRIYVADTYNNKIKLIDAAKKTVATLAGTGKPGATDLPATFDEPAGVSLAGGKLYVADTNNHLIRVVDLEHDTRVSTLAIKGLAPPPPTAKTSKPNFSGGANVKLPAVSIKPTAGKLVLDVALSLPAGYKINAEGPMSYLVESDSAASPIDPAALGKGVAVSPPADKFQIALPLAKTSGEDTLKISLGIYYCQTGDAGICKATSVIWTLPVKLAADAKSASAKLGFEVR